MQLQGDAAVRALGLRIGVVDHLHSVEAGDVVVAFDDEQVFIPLVLADYSFILGRGPNDPATAYIVDAAGMLANGAVDFELRALHDVRSSWLERHVKEDAAISIALAFEPQREMKVCIILRGLEITIVLGYGKPVDRTILDIPLFVAD